MAACSAAALVLVIPLTAIVIPEIYGALRAINKLIPSAARRLGHRRGVADAFARGLLAARAILDRPIRHSSGICLDRHQFRRPRRGAFRTLAVKHVDKPGGTTFAAFAPVTARYLRWQVTEVMPGRSLNLGGQSIEFFAPGEPDDSPHGIGIEAERTPPIVEPGTAGSCSHLLLASRPLRTR